ncbi:MAG: guanylate kinase [Bacteroidales bacterium]
MNKQGKLIIFSAPSGSGKTTIVHRLIQGNKNLSFSISATSREKRPEEEDGKDYYFLSVDEFKNHCIAHDFLEWEEVYKDQFYGTLKSEVQRIWDFGKQVVFDVDVIGGLNIKKQFPSQSLAIFIQPPSLDILKDRLLGRGTESEESLKKRLEKAEKEMSYASKFDVIIINEHLDKAIEETQKIVNQFLQKK